MLMLVIIILILSVYGAVNFYIGLRCWQALGSQIQFLNSKVYWIFFALLVFSYFIGRLTKWALPGLVSNFFIRTGAYWMAAMIYFLLAVVTIDLIRLLNRLFGFLPDMTKKSDFSFWLGALIILAVVILMAVGTWWAQNLHVKRYDLTIHKEAGSMKSLHAVMISDLHLGDIVDRRQLKKMVDKINGLQPEIVFIAGDIIDDDIQPFIRQGMAEEFRRLKPRLGVYACMGNHDYYGGKQGDMMDQFKEAGITLLRDSAMEIEHSFSLVGREDKTMERTSSTKRKPLTQLMDGLNPTLPVIVMDHEPSNLSEAEKAGVDLQLSGHTHQGQLFPGNLITNLVFKVDYGYERMGDYNIVVSSGAGTWGPPVRIGTNSEIVDIRIRFQ